MSVKAPSIDGRTYQSLLDDAIARISTHNPEWTNFNSSDPGITLLSLFAFMTETLVYRTNLIPDRNRMKFLDLLGLPLTRASTATGLITLANDHGPLETQTVGGGLGVQAGSVMFHTDAGLDLLPIEAQVVTKQRVANPPPAIQAQQQRLYATFTNPPATTPGDLAMYETVPLDRTASGVTLSATADDSVWIALLLRKRDAASASSPDALQALIRLAADQLGSATLSLGFVPVVADLGVADLQPSNARPPSGAVNVTVQVPNVPPGGRLPLDDAGLPAPAYLPLDARWPSSGLEAPGVVQITLPSADAIGVWSDIDPITDGVGALPPSTANSDIGSRVITWLQIQRQAGADVTLLWAGINAAMVTQRTHVTAESLPPGTGQPDQTVSLAHTPVLPESVVLTVVEPDGKLKTWTRIDDLLDAGPEVPVPDPRRPPGTPMPPATDPDVYALDPSTGIITFGDGTRGRRPPSTAQLTADYDYGAGAAGNVGVGALTSGLALPTGVTVTNPVPTWGGADAESIDEAEKQTARYLQHRDRCVTVEDFQVVTYRTPGVDIGRVEVLPATNPDIQPFTTGTSPGAVTVMVIPSTDPVNPDAPQPTPAMMSAIAAYLDPRRLVTTQLFLRGPQYVGIWVSVGITVVAGASIADVTVMVKDAVRAFLAPINPAAPPWWQEDDATSPDNPLTESRGWPLQKDVNPLELQAVASRVTGVDLVNPVLVAPATGGPTTTSIPMIGLQLPQLLRISVVSGTPTDISVLQGGGATSGGPGTSGSGGAGTGGTTEPPLIPVPVIPETC